MSRPVLAGSRLNEIWGSLRRFPTVQLLVWDPLRTTLGDIASGTAQDPPIDLSPWLERIEYEENTGFENGNDPSIPRATFQFRRNPKLGEFRRGWIEDGVIYQLRQGDVRVSQADWLPIMTGTFRGRPGDNPGTRADHTEGFQAVGFGREERFLNLDVTTDSFPGPVDVGHIAYTVAWKHMGLGQNEIRFGNQGKDARHTTNQLVEINALQALYECLFPVGKKPRFNGLGQLVAVDVDLDKPATRIFSEGNILVESQAASPNDIEVANQVILRGLDHNLTRVIQEAQLLTEFDVTTGFFDSSFNRPIYYSQDHTQRAQDTYLVQKKKIRWSNGAWTQVDEFHGRLRIDTRYLRNVRAIIFGTYLALQLAIATLDLIAQQTGVGEFTAILRYALQIASQLALAALLWSMNFIGNGHYEVWGKPFEYVYQELVSDNRLVGLDPDELRKFEYRNDFVSTIEELDALGAQRLRREILKNQLYEISILDDPRLEVDDVIETEDGNRYYIVALRKTIQRGGKATLSLTCWKVFDDVLSPAKAAARFTSGYGFNYANHYGEGL